MVRTAVIRQSHNEQDSALISRPQSSLSDFVRASEFDARSPDSRLLFASSATSLPVVPRLRDSPPALMRSALTVNEPGDPFEQEADRVADQVMRMPDPIRVQRTCAPCEEREQLQRKCASCEEEEENKLQRNHTGSGPEHAPAIVHEVLNSPGQPLDPMTRAFFEPRFGHDFSRVRVHYDEQAAQSAEAVNARAYTVGTNIVFGSQEYALHHNRGRHLLAHELTHVQQQTADHDSAASGLLQRTTHGPSTPTNCHNWKIPLPPWIAGTLAHGQISAFLGILPHRIPRAAKLFKGFPSSSLIPAGFADLWKNMVAINVAEIKSTATGSTVAADDARHYRDRHNEWLVRAVSGTGDPLDATYLAEVGGLLPGGLLDLSTVTGTDLTIGPFVGDPAKLLHIEADSGGAMVYWCTGAGMPISPLWIPAAKAAMDRLKKLLEKAKKAAQEVVTEVADALAAIGKVLLKILLIVLAILLIVVILALLIIAIICLAGIPVTLGGSSICSAVAVAGAVAAAAVLLLIIGVDISRAPDASASLFRSINPELAQAEPENGADYERQSDRMFSPVSTPSGAAATVASFDPLAAFQDSLSPVTDGLDDPLSMIRTLSSSLTSMPSDAVAKLDNATTVLEQSGDRGTAAFIRDIVQRTRLATAGSLAQASADDDAHAFALLERVGLGENARASVAAGETAPENAAQEVV